MTEDLVEPGRQIRRLALEPSDGSVVRSSTIVAGHALARGEPDQHVAEPEPVRPDAFDQSLPRERTEVALDEGA